MPVQRKAEVIRNDAMTIVVHSNQVEPTTFDRDFDAGCVRINAILDEFFDNLSRPFDNLAGSDVTNGQLIQLEDAGLLNQGFHLDCVPRGLVEGLRLPWETGHLGPLLVGV